MAVTMIRMADFLFPRALPNGKANFRFLLDIRYIEEDKLQSLRIVRPSLEEYWECDEGRREKDDEDRKKGELFVRAADSPRFDMELVGEWNSVITGLPPALQQIQVKILDVDRDDWHEQVAEVIKGAGPEVGGYLGLPTIVGTVIDGALGLLFAKLAKRGHKELALNYKSLTEVRPGPDQPQRFDMTLDPRAGTLDEGPEEEPRKYQIFFEATSLE